MRTITAIENGKQRLCIEYSQIINRFNHLDADPLPRIRDQVNEIGKFRIFSTLGLKSACQQIPLLSEDKIYTYNEKLYQFTRIPFCLTSIVAAFNRTMDNFIAENDLKILDNLSIAGITREEHNESFSELLAAARKHNFTFNENKSIISVDTVKLLGYAFSHKSIKSDPE